MKCPGCGYVSFDPRETCKNCGAPTTPRSGPDAGLQGLRLEPEPRDAGRQGRGPRRRAKAPDPGPEPVEMLDDDAFEVDEEDLAVPGSELPRPADREMPFRIDEEIFAEPVVGVAPPAVRHERAGRTEAWQPLAVDLPEPAFVLPDERLVETGGEPVIDRDDEIPDQFWAPEIAGIGRRGLALLVDQTILAALLGVFFLGAFLALQLSGFETNLFLAAAGLRAALLPFALLAAVLSFAYQAFFHGYAGRTPGKALAGVVVRTGDGAVPSWGRVLFRWFCAVLGLMAGGVGLAWALFEPRRRGWADLLSGTVIARQRR